MPIDSNKPLETNQKQKNITKNIGARRVKSLAGLSLALWLASLALPGFTLNGDPSKIYYGLHILIEGVLLGWLTGKIAAYANIAYIYAVATIYADKTPIKSTILMIGVASTTFFVHDILVDEGGHHEQITSWGWGVVIWGVSLLLLGIATLTKLYQLSIRSIGIFLTIPLLIVLSIFAVNIHQWNNANSQDRHLYLTRGTAFTVAKLCEVPISRVSAPIVQEGDHVIVDHSMNEFMSAYLHWSGPILKTYEQDGFEWTYRDNRPDYVIGRKIDNNAKPAKYVLRVVSRDSTQLIQLIDNYSHTIAYEQKIQFGSFHGRNHCPAAYGYQGYIQSILTAIGQNKNSKYYTGIRTTEEARIDCSDEYITPLINGRRTPQKFCSNKYIVIWYPNRSPTEGTNSIYLSAMALDRESMALVDNYSDHITCPGRDCDLVYSQEHIGFRVTESSIYLLTPAGDIEIKKEYRNQ
ncbi:hypothetical protein RQP54_10885 [Curvibacter sp. APW13]|uniref:hypothetical protein n=1 Tax=Curvibacter sp. APW13 TaxID=3077236 RepID=UPI0028DEE245|nr:hypothetical protein [Curvibacter sp. APW13]MDT8991365.1 hypothetical protein [Curvibacter sp. APW13]